MLEVIIFRGAHVACTPVDHSCAPLIIVDRTLSFVEQCDYLHMFETLDMFYMLYKVHRLIWQKIRKSVIKVIHVCSFISFTLTKRVLLCAQVWPWPARWSMYLSRCVWGTRRSLADWGTVNSSPQHSHPPASDCIPCPLLPSQHQKLSHQPPPPSPRLSPILQRLPPAPLWQGEVHAGTQDLNVLVKGAEISGRLQPQRSPPSCPPTGTLMLGVPSNWSTETRHREGGGREEGRKEGTEQVLTPPLPLSETFYICRHHLVSRGGHGLLLEEILVS